MFGLTARTSWPNGPGSRVGSLKAAGIGEIDTRAPFQSVKAAVSLFGDAVSPRSSPATKKADERVLEKETQHHMILRELDCYKDQLRSAEIAKSQALKELERANTTLQQLTNNLDNLTESKQELVKATEAAKERVKDLEELKSLRAQARKQDLENENERYKATAGELVLRKQELSNLRQDLDAALEAKMAVFQEAEVAQHNAEAAQGKHSRILKEVASVTEALNQVKLESIHKEEEHSKLIAEKEALLMKYKSTKEEAEKEIKNLREENDPPENLKEKLEETTKEINVLHAQLNVFSASDLYPLLTILRELESNKKALQQVVAEEKSIRSSLDPLKLQLEEVKRKHHKSSLEKLIASNDIASEAEKSRHEAEEIKNNAQLLKQEAEAARIAAKEAEGKLQIALKQAEEAKAAKKLAEDQISKGSGYVKKIRLSAEEFELMNKKIEEVRNQADVKVATAMAQVETINGRDKEVFQKIEVILKENKDIQSEIENALTTAEMAEAAKIAVAGELQKWRQKEQSL
ncbi:hypothetical protein ACJIZ3_012849 [Penstemon smallii]|uniref:Uncharacterized protein n=1 Tax=Penstemon smallii TaxID=265156 RepID=A0ABD3UN87_9LAMI